VALSVKLALSESPRPLAGMLPYGDRTFLPRPFKKSAGDCPSGKLGSIIEIWRPSSQVQYLRNEKTSGVSPVHSCILFIQVVSAL